MSDALNSSIVEEKQRKRDWLLHNIYKQIIIDGKRVAEFNMPPDIFVNLQDYRATLDYLLDKKFVIMRDDEGCRVGITIRGIDEVEKVISNPQKTTEPVNVTTQVIQNFHGPVGSVGNQNTVHFTQNIGAEITDITALLKELRQHIVDDTPERRQDGLELLAGLEAEAQSPSQSKSRIKLYLKEVGTFVKDTGKDILVSIGTE